MTRSSHRRLSVDLGRNNPLHLSSAGGRDCGVGFWITVWGIIAAGIGRVAAEP